MVGRLCRPWALSHPAKRCSITRDPDRAPAVPGGGWPASDWLHTGYRSGLDKYDPAWSNSRPRSDLETPGTLRARARHSVQRGGWLDVLPLCRRSAFLFVNTPMMGVLQYYWLRLRKPK